MRQRSKCELGVCSCPDICQCIGLGCDHAGTRMSWAHPTGRRKMKSEEDFYRPSEDPHHV